MAPKIRGNETATDYDHEIPGVVRDTDPNVEELKSSLSAKIKFLLAGGLITGEQVADFIVSADSIKKLAAPKQADPVKDLIARTLLETFNRYKNIHLDSAERAYDDFRTDYLIGMTPRVPYFERTSPENDISSRNRTLRQQLFKILH